MHRNRIGLRANSISCPHQQILFRKGTFQRNEDMLHFVEDYLGFSPDGGDGSIEVLLVVMAIVMAVWIALRVGKPNKAR